MRIVLGADHGGYKFKEKVKQFLFSENSNVTIEDLGCSSENSVDYPDYAETVCKTILQDKADMGILICGTGIGMSIAANRYQKIRAAVCHDEYTAEMSRAHNNANILCLGARVISEEDGKKIILKWLKTDFEGGRHQRRIDKFSE